MPHAPTPASPAEPDLQRTLHAALARSRDVLLDCPDVTDLDGAVTPDEMEERFDTLAASVAEAAAAVTALRGLDDLSHEGAMVVGSADVALAALRSTLAAFAAGLDAARDDAA